MNIVKEGFKGLIEHVRKVIFELLCPLDRKQRVHATSTTPQRLLLESINSIAEVIGCVFHLQIHVTTDPSTFRVQLQILPKTINCISSRLHAHISQDTIIGVEQLAKPLEEEHMRRQFPFVFVLDHEEHIVIFFLLFLQVFGFFIPVFL